MPFHQYFYASNRKIFKKYATPNCCNILKSTKVTKQRSITFTTGLAQNTLPNRTIVSDRSRPTHTLLPAIETTDVIGNTDNKQL